MNQARLDRLIKLTNDTAAALSQIAAGDGRGIQGSNNGFAWWDWSAGDEYSYYRLKPTPPEPTVTPWTFENAPLTLKVRRKSDGVVFRANTFPDAVLLWEYSSGSYISVSYQQLRDYFEQLNGQPCGVVKGGAK